MPKWNPTRYTVLKFTCLLKDIILILGYNFNRLTFFHLSILPYFNVLYSTSSLQFANPVDYLKYLFTTGFTCKQLYFLNYLKLYLMCREKATLLRIGSLMRKKRLNARG